MTAVRRRGVVRALAMTMAVGGLTACSHTDGRELADPDPDLTATTAAAAVVEGAVPGSQNVDVAPSSTGQGGLSLSSPAFEPGGPIPARFTCMAGDTSPPLEWSSVPPGTAELALAMRSPTSGGALYWLVTGIDPSTAGLAENEQPAAIVPWTGPCPTPSTPQQYVFSLYALPEPFEPDRQLAADEVAALLEGIAPAPATVSGTFTR